MAKQRVIYYTDELNDEFSSAVITPKRIDGTYCYVKKSPLAALTHFFAYRVIAAPIAFLYSKLVFGRRIKNAHVTKGVKGGYFLFGNHTQAVGDALMPHFINFRRAKYVVVHPNNVSMPVLGRVTPTLGALPLPDDMTAAKNFMAAMKHRVEQGNVIFIYPEAHIWPYFVGIRPFPDTSFYYPIKFDVPVFCFTNTYQKRKLRKKPRIVTYVDGPFYPDKSLPLARQRGELRDRVYHTMCERARVSNQEYVKYIKKEEEQT